MALTTRKAHKQQNFSPTSLACIKPPPTLHPPPLQWGERADLHRLTSWIQTPEGHTHLTVFNIEVVVLWSLARNREVSGERDYYTERKTHVFSLIWYWYIYKKFIFTFSMLTFLTNSLLGQFSLETLHITNKFNRPFWVALPQVSFSNWELLQW